MKTNQKQKFTHSAKLTQNIRVLFAVNRQYRADINNIRESGVVIKLQVDTGEVIEDEIDVIMSLI